MKGKQKWSSGRVVKRSSDRASGFSTGPLGHWITGSLCLCLLLGVGCEKTQSELFKPQLVIHGQIQVGNTDSLYVQVNRTYRIGETYDWNFGDPSVTVSHGWLLTRPSGQTADEHNNFRPTLAVRPGDTFDIQVVEPGFDTVRGRTVVPDTFHFLYPRAGDTVTLSDSLGWTRSRTAAGYFFSILRDVNGKQTSYDIVIGNDSAGSDYDSTKVHFAQMLFYYGEKPGLKTLVVYAVDSSYYDWMRLVGYGTGGGAPPETTRLTGGLGVFGSAAVETLRVYFKPDSFGRRYGSGGAGKSKGESQEAKDKVTGHGSRSTVRGPAGLNVLRS